MSGNTEDDAIIALENKMMSYCNLVPVGCWGFDDDVKESLKQRKHSLVNRQLNKKERKQFSAQQKQQLARNLGLVPNSVQEVIEWMSTSKELSKVQPVKAKDVPKKAEKKVQAKKVEAEEESDEDSDNEEVEEAKTNIKVAPEDEDEDSEEEEEEDDAPEADEEEDSEEEEVEEASEDDDSTDEEEEKEEPAAKKLKLAGSVLKSNDKIDKEIEKLENDEDNESPEIKRQIALLRLQKKLKDMKHDRKGKTKNAKLTPAMTAKLAEEKRLKRRESKMKLKQRRAEEKKAKEVKTEGGVKKEVSPDENSEVKTNGISFNRLKFEIKDDKQRGKRDRVAKKDRGLKLTGRDYKSLIAKVEETRATIAKVREADPHKATIMEDELKWEKTIKRAEGGKVKDNLQMLKKALAKKNKLKEKKKEKWENREKKVVEKKDTKQEKRKGNLQKRIDDVKKRKVAKLRKKGRML